MEPSLIREAITRIREMESCFDALQTALRQNPAEVSQEEPLRELLRNLMQYYEGGQWLRDYELDERGLLPGELKRGVLSQDGLYDLLERIRLYSSSR